MKFKTALNTSRNMIKECFLCGSRASYIGVFIPKDKAEFNQLDKKSPGFFYGLCKSCFNIEGKETMVEDKILNEL